ncbi:MAG: Lsr2 family protein [Corynebacterium sp.]|uniref:histone-like nucleoid-structuring protein Lsr2 n=1 Tax=Corynebacterium sp. TaxID=1720 RepID=UPI0026DF4AFE|nr:Lsr2 family protein [Corynebacterium sp.]MDO5669271.1 Lsr2 family protein [Corynebacterium sp.]
MARREITQYFDDLDNSPLKDDEVNIIRFSVDGNNYIIDLSEKNAAAFHKDLQPWVDAARKDTGATKTTRTSGPSAAAKRERSRAIREWARSKNMEVSDRGKIAASIIEAYDAAHA